MKKLFVNKLSILLMVFSILISQSDDLSLPLPYGYKSTGLLVFLDDSEKTVDAIGSDLLTALSQRVGPFIVSASIVKNIFSAYRNIHELNGTSNADLYGRYIKLKTSKSDMSQNAQAIKNYYLKVIDFQKHEWIIKAVSSDLYLFIFKADLDLQKIGLNIDAMKESSIEDILISKQSGNRDYFEENLDKIFSKAKCFWTIYMTGHGLVGNEICGMSRGAFKNVLSFFNNDIKTRLFIYSSCFAGGVNFQYTYDKLANYNFAIVSQSNADAPTSKTAVRIDKNFTLDSAEDYSKFFQLINSHYSYKQITAAVFPLIPKLNFLWGNLPLIRVPNSNNFDVLANLSQEKELHKVVIIDEKTELANPFNFQNNIYKAILLYVKEIPSTLIITSPEMQAIVSMIPGEALHNIDNIKSNSNELSAIFKWFMSIDQLAAKKVFYIAEIEAKDKTISDAIIYLDIIEPSNLAKVQGATSKFKVTAYYKDLSGKIFFQEAVVDSSRSLGITQLSKPTEVDQSRLAQFNSFYAHATGSIDRIAGMDFKTNELFNSFWQARNNDKYSSSVIDFINCSGYSVYMILDSCLDIVQNGSFLWINTVSGQYSDNVMSKKISKIVNNGGPVTVTNVLVSKVDGSFRIYYTFDNKFYNARTPTEDITEKDLAFYQEYIKKYGKNNIVKSNIVADHSEVKYFQNLDLVSVTTSLSIMK